MLASASRASSDLRPATGPKFLSTRLWVSCLSSSPVRVGAICAAAEMAASDTITSAIAVWRIPKRRSIEYIVFFLPRPWRTVSRTSFRLATKTAKGPTQNRSLRAEQCCRDYQMSFKPNWIERFAPVPRTGLGDAWSGVLQLQPKVADAEGSLAPAPAGPLGL